MVPWIANRGNSFKGAGMYYLHDKEAQTSERVAWTYTHNLPTDDPHKAMKWMAATAIQSDMLKKEAGIKPTGRKSTKGVVYAYALAWHPDEKPEPQHMREKAMETLELLGLSEHQAVFVAHQETNHDHVHCVVNLIHPETGKTAVLYKDQLRLSEWALKYEQENGQVYCKEREKNNELRKDKSNQNKIIKHKEEKLERANLIQNLYERSDSGKAFNAALEEQGYSIARGDKRGFVLVDHNGEIYSLSRQLKGQRASDIKNRLADLDNNALPQAKELSETRKYFYRDDYETQWQKDITEIHNDENISKESKKPQLVQSFKESSHQPQSSKNSTNSWAKDKLYSGSSGKYLAYWEKRNDLMKEADKEKSDGKKTFDQNYKITRKRMIEEGKTLNTEINSTKGIGSKNRLEELKEKAEMLRKSFIQFDEHYHAQCKAVDNRVNQKFTPKFEALDREYGIEPSNTSKQEMKKSVNENEHTKFRDNDFNR